MRKTAFGLAFVLAVCVLPSLGPFAAQKNGVLKIVPDPEFGTKTPWDALFDADRDKDLAFLPDGGFFRASYKDGKVYRFSASGEKVFEFGRKGSGPGDLLNPLLLDILDGRSLLVYEEGNHRISVFGLDGTFLKAVKTKDYISSLATLANSQIAMARWKYGSGQGSSIVKQFVVSIVDVGSEAEKEIALFDDEKPRSPISVRVDPFDGTVRVARVGENKFLVAYSKSAEVAFYAFDGRKMGSFDTGIKPEKITWDHLMFVLKPEKMSAREKQGFDIVIAPNKDKIRLPELHQRYLGLAVDSANRVVLVLNNLAARTDGILLRTYGPDGKPLGETKIDPGDYLLRNPHDIHIRGGSLYTTLEKKDADGTQILARIKIAD